MLFRSYAAYRARIEALLADLADARGVAVDPRAGAIGLTALLDGLWLELCLDPATFSAEEAVGIVRRFVDGFLKSGYTTV